jgi:Na+/H+ antiporter NhaC
MSNQLSHNYSSLIIIIPLSILIPIFVSLASKLSYEMDPNLDKIHLFSLYPNRNSNTKTEIEKQTISSIEKNRYIFKTVIGLLLIILSLMYVKGGPSFLYGVGLGGAFTLLSANIDYWRYLDNTAKTYILGFVIVSLIGIGHFLYK